MHLHNDKSFSKTKSNKISIIKTEIEENCYGLLE